MKRLKILSLILALAMAAVLAPGCADKTPPAAAASPAPVASTAPAAEPAPAEPAAPAETTSEETAVTVTDMTGREVTLETRAERVVALTAADCEILYAIGAGDALVGRGEYCDWPEEVFAVPSVQSGSETNIEQILELEPDLLLMGTMAQSEEQVAALEAAGVKVVVSDAQDIEGTYEAIAMIGALMGRDDEAAAVTDGMKAAFEEISAKAGEKEGMTVYFEVSPLQYGLWSAGSGTFMNEIANLMGLENIFADVVGWGEVSEEQVIERDPDIIVTISMYYGEGPTPVEEILSRKGWENIAAVKNAAILNLTGNELSRPGPRLRDGAEMLFEFAYVTLEADKAA